MKKQKYIVLLLTLVIVGILVSTVTAVPYTSSEGIRSRLTVEEKFQKIITSKSFLRYQAYVENIANKTFNETKKSMIHNTIIDKIIPSLNLSIDTKDPLYPGLVAFLQAIIDGTVLILGHNVVGFTTAYIFILLIVFLLSIVAFPFYFVIGCVILPMDMVVDPYFFDGIIYQFGAIGALVIAIFFIPIAFCVVLLCGTFVGVFGTLEGIIDTLSYLVF